MNKFNEKVNSVLNEARKPFDPSDFNSQPAKTEVSLIPMRAQPFHRGHNSLVENAKYPVIIGIVKGKKTSQDKEKNPFDFNDQRDIIKATGNSKIKDIIEIPSANIVQIVSDLRDKGLEVKEVWAGSDRIKPYTAMTEKYAEPMNWNIKVNEIIRDRSDGIAGISATKVREALRDDDYVSAGNMMGIENLNFVKKLAKKIR